MTKQEIVSKVCGQCVNIKKKDIKTVLNAYLDTIGHALSADEDVPLGALGKLKIVERAERHCVNPQTKQELIVPAHKTVKFSPSKALKEAMKV